jgi:DNA-binding transcriptional ArsR family regulator
MILSHGMGASSYVPDVLVGGAQDEVDHGLVAFVQCYARDPREWEMLIYFADHESWSSAGHLAVVLGESRYTIERKLDSLAAKKLVEERVLLTGPLYRLAQSDQLRRRVMRLATTLRGGATLSM